MRLLNWLRGLASKPQAPSAPTGRVERIPWGARHRVHDEDVRAAQREGTVIVVVFWDGAERPLGDPRPSRSGKR